jgi:hypothetical protein
MGRTVVWAILALAAASPAPATVVDDFARTEGWSPHPADGVELAIHPDSGAMRLDFRFLQGSGYAVAHKDLSIDLPENYAFTFRIRGDCAPNDLEFKLIDATGENVWWCVRRGVQFPARWETYKIKKRQIGFAWGPQGGGEIRHVQAIEFAITAGTGGAGSVWIDDLELTAMPPATEAPPAPTATATSHAGGGGPAYAVDGDSTTAWVSGAGDSRPVLTLDLGGDREYGGVIVDWKRGRQARAYALETSDDGKQWRILREVRDGNGGRDYHYLPESESRRLRIRVIEGATGEGVAIAEATLEPLAWGATLESFYAEICKDAPRGCYPRAIGGERISWTVLGDDAGDREEGLLGEDGALETGKGCYSIEPFLFVGGRLITWNEVRTEHSHAQGGVPIPTVSWRREEVELGITAFAVDGPAALRLLGRDSAAVTPGNALLARYRARNSGSLALHATLYLALRPFQVHPPTQFLNARGGTAAIRDLAREGSVIRVNGDRGVVSLAPIDAFGASTFDAGDVVADYLRFGRLPEATAVSDRFERASGAIAYELDLAAGEEREIDILVPLHARPEAASAASGSRTPEAAEDRCREGWLAHRRGIEIAAPDSARDLLDTMWAQLAYILINRDGAAIQPGSRSYERSWIRDGALTSSALLRLGHPEIVRAFIEWFAPNQYPSGKIPCVVDARGPDPVPEHDSSGEFIFLVAEYDRYVHDRAFLERMWPRVDRAAAYLDSLRRTRRTPDYLLPDAKRFYGLLPPSISHEGYSAKPMHSYWDDLFALRGFKDAVYVARTLGLAREQARLEAIRDEFARDLTASIAATCTFHGIDYMPGCADLGDFDATSTTIAFDPVGAQGVVPEGALRRTFERYWESFTARRDGPQTWEAFTPYEIRNVGAFVALGWRGRAQELLRYFLDHRDPPGWEQWAEVVWREPRLPRFIGDLPHTWVGSDYVRSILDMLAYEREADSTLVVGAGIPYSWLTGTGGFRLRGLPTRHGELSYAMWAADGSTTIRVEEGLRIPPGGIVLRPPTSGSTSRATVNGVAAGLGSMGEIVLRALPAEVVLSP